MTTIALASYVLWSLLIGGADILMDALSFGATGRPSKQRSLDGARPGQLILIVAGALTALLGFAALATDVGFLWNTKRQMQTAADSAAMAGEQELVAPNSGATITSAARNDAASNGF